MCIRDSRTAGHKKGAEVFSDIADYCDELGVSSVYFYAFSTENWKRPLDLLGNTEHPAAARRACNAVRTARNEAAHALSLIHIFPPVWWRR